MTTTLPNGGYAFSLLAPGTYSVFFAAPGFATERDASVAINVSEATALNAELQMADPAQAEGAILECLCRIAEAASSSTGTL